MADREATAERPRLGWRRAGLIAGIAVVVVAVGAAGLVIGRATAPGPDILVLSGPVVQETSSADLLPTGGAVNADHLVVAGDAVAAPAVFTPAAELADSPTTASGYRLTRSGLDGAEVAAGLASVLGVDGEVERNDDGWSVGGVDPDSPVLLVSDDPQLSWSFTDPVATEIARAGVFVTPGRAEAVATALLGEIGVDLSVVDWQSTRFDDHLALTATRLVGDSRTSLAWQVNFGQNEAVVSASGFAAEFVEVPGYEVVGAATAVRRAGLPTWSVIGPTPVVPDEETVAGAQARPADELGPGDRPALHVAMASIVVVDATLGLAQFWQPDGGLLVLPAYQLVGDDGTLWTLIAVTGDYVDFVDEAYPGVSSPAQ